MAEYRVTWDIDIEADSAEEAARKALAIQRKPDSVATVFFVRERNDAPMTFPIRVDADPTIDVWDPEDPGGTPAYSGLASRAWETVPPGVYTDAMNDDAEPVLVTVTETSSYAVEVQPD